MRVTRSKWLVPLLSVALGIVVFAAQWVGGDPGSGLVSLAIMTGFGALILLGGRSKPSAGYAAMVARTLPQDRHPCHRARGPRGNHRRSSSRS